MIKRNIKESKRISQKTKLITLISIITIIGLLVGLGSGLLQYSFAAVKCLRAPVAASKFMASYTYELPGEEGYGPGIFNEYFCSEQDARDAGFRPSVMTKTGKAESEAFWKAYEEKKRFSPDKVDFKVYIPNLPNYSVDEMSISSMGSGESNRQVFFPLKKDGYVIASVREGKAPNEYEICNRPKDSCEVIATEDGGVINKQTADNGIAYYGSTFNGTFINLGEVDSEISVDEVISIYSSLKEYADE